MCSEPVMRAPLRGCAPAYSRRIAIRPGISCSASVTSLRPKPASVRSATLKSVFVMVAVEFIVSSMVTAVRSAARELRLQFVDHLYRRRVDAAQGGEVDRDEVAEQ